MDGYVLVVALFLITALATIIFAQASKKKTEERMKDETAPKSSLAVDGPNHNADT